MGWEKRNNTEVRPVLNVAPLPYYGDGTAAVSNVALALIDKVFCTVISVRNPK